MDTYREGLRRLARKVIIESLLDYVKAHKTLARPNASPQMRQNAADIQADVKSFFNGRESDPWFELSGYNREWLFANFVNLASDPQRMIDAAKIRLSDTEQ
ncbi:MAG: hypothetical protein ACK4S4_15725 [Pyrinomonadaceae bacterium]